jgi:hypothetical protein
VTSNAGRLISAAGTTIHQIVGAMGVMGAVGPISNGTIGGAGKSSPGVNDRLIFAVVTMTVGGNGNSASSTCGKCAG